jgi:hypothetical protein
MGAKRPPAALTAFPISAIVSLDPAAVGPAGLAVRLTAPLIHPVRGKLRAPDFYYEGCIFSSVMHDDLTSFLAEKVGRGGRALLVVEDAIYGARTTARHLGRAIGAIESVLNDVNLAEPKHTRYVYPGHWRKVSLPVDSKGDVEATGRDNLKQAAIDTVATLYGLELGADGAEAVLINDYVVLARPEWWNGTKAPTGGRKKKKAA